VALILSSLAAGFRALLVFSAGFIFSLSKQVRLALRSSEVTQFYKHPFFSPFSPPWVGEGFDSTRPETNGALSRPEETILSFHDSGLDFPPLILSFCIRKIIVSPPASRLVFNLLNSNRQKTELVCELFVPAFFSLSEPVSPSPPSSVFFLSTSFHPWAFIFFELLPPNRIAGISCSFCVRKFSFFSTSSSVKVTIPIVTILVSDFNPPPAPCDFLFPFPFA